MKPEHKLFKDCFTGKDNSTYDIARILWSIGVMVYIALAIVDVYLRQKFQYSEFGTGFGIVLGAGGFSVWLKRNTEPSPKNIKE